MIRHYDATRFEGLIRQGRTSPLQLACREQGTENFAESKMVKTVGNPTIFATHQLVSEVIGNAVARQMGIETADPGIVHISDQMAVLINKNISNHGRTFRISSGAAAGCNYLNPPPAPFVVDQILTPANQRFANLIYIFDFLTGNPDRRPENPNCGFCSSNLIAYDFEMCFSDCYLPQLVKGIEKPWDVMVGSMKNHLFFGVVRKQLFPIEEIQNILHKLSAQWWQDLLNYLPESWKIDASKVEPILRLAVERSEEFANDLGRSLL